ncbi:MAG: hypothetical protein ACE5H9_14700 [Anaerolineae bacterium]
MVISHQDLRLRRLAKATVNEFEPEKQFKIRITYYDTNSRPVSRYEIHDGVCEQTSCSVKQLGPH